MKTMFIIKYWKDILDTIQLLFVALTSVVAMYGIDTWRREFKWKKKYELAEELLLCVYEVRECFTVIRNPFISAKELTPNQTNESTPSDILKRSNQASAIFDRIERSNDFFMKLNVLEHRFVLLFGKEVGKYIENLFYSRMKLIQALRLLENKYWKDQGTNKFTEQEFQTHLREMERLEAIIWAGFHENDEFMNLIEQDIREIENICAAFIRNR